MDVIEEMESQQRFILLRKYYKYYILYIFIYLYIFSVLQIVLPFNFPYIKIRSLLITRLRIY